MSSNDVKATSKRTASRQSAYGIDKAAEMETKEEVINEETAVGLDTINTDLREGPIDVKDTSKLMKFTTPGKRSPKNYGSASIVLPEESPWTEEDESDIKV